MVFSTGVEKTITHFCELGETPNGLRYSPSKVLRQHPAKSDKGTGDSPDCSLSGRANAILTEPGFFRLELQSHLSVDKGDLYGKLRVETT
jgi:hypothetical protein